MTRKSKTAKVYDVGNIAYADWHAHFPYACVFELDPPIPYKAIDNEPAMADKVLLTSIHTISDGDGTKLFPTDETGFPMMAVNLRKDDHGEVADSTTVFKELGYKEVI